MTWLCYNDIKTQLKVNNHACGDKSMNNDFGLLLAQYREQRLLSQTDLARALRIHPSHISRMERGLRNAPSRAKVLQISKIFGLSEDESNELLIIAGYAPQNSLGGRFTSENNNKVQKLATNKTVSELSSYSVPSNIRIDALSHMLRKELTDILGNHDLLPEERILIHNAYETVPLVLNLVSKLNSNSFRFQGLKPKDILHEHIDLRRATQGNSSSDQAREIDESIQEVIKHVTQLNDQKWSPSDKVSAEIFAQR